MNELDHPASHSEFWQKRWEEQRTGWDTGSPHNLIPELLDMAKKYSLLEGTKFLEPGAGRGHQGACIAKLGFAVTSYDVSPIAVAEGANLYKDIASFKLEEWNFFHTNVQWQNKFDAIFDRAVLCALPPEKRQEYINTQTQYLKPKGLFLTIPFREIASVDGKQEGPPFAISMEELQSLFFENYTLLNAKDYHYSDAESRIKKESLMVWQKK